jgi:cyclic lactone autoinducer peptide
MKKFFSILATLLTVLGAVVASSASFILLHQPKTPKSLQK